MPGISASSNGQIPVVAMPPRSVGVDAPRDNAVIRRLEVSGPLKTDCVVRIANGNGQSYARTIQYAHSSAESLVAVPLGMFSLALGSRGDRIFFDNLAENLVNKPLSSTKK